MLIAADSRAQIRDKSIEDIYVTLDLQNVRLDDALEQISNTTGFTFAYNEKLINLRQRVNIQVHDESLANVLLSISENSNLKFKRINEYIHVGKRESSKDAAVEEKIIEQGTTVTGRVTSAEDGEGLPGVNVIEKGTRNGTVTDLDGAYKLDVSDQNASLVFSSVGFNTEEVVVGNRSNIDITLTTDVTALEEIVVVGYGTQMKKDITGSIASVEASQIETRPITSVEEGIQGLIPGVNIAQRSASPGELATVSIRGLGSITAGTAPLWVVDGFPTDQRNAQAISPADIESVEVLKDASSSAIYGSRGANGVIIITTKSGKEGRSTLNFSLSGGVATVPEYSRFEVLNAEEYVQFHTEQNDGTVPDFIADNWDGTTSTDWQDLIFREGIFQNYAVSASGGSEKVNYLLAGNYIDQEGVVKGEGQTKYSARVKVNYKPADWFTMGINLAPNIITIRRQSVATDQSDWASLYAQSVLLAPILPIYREDGTFSMNSDLPGALPIGNPLETMQNYDFDETLFRFLGGLDLNFEITEGLNLRSTVSANIGTNKNETYYLPTVGQNVPQAMSPVSSYSTGQSQSIDWLNENTINYRREFGDHSFDVLGGFTLQHFRSESVSASVRELQVPGVRNVNIGNSDTRDGFNGSSESSLVSYLGRLNYGFKDRYLITGTVRTDGSSVFGANNRYQTFASFALGWRFSEEAFMQDFKNLNSGKLRFSYGTTGSNSIPPFASRATLNALNHAFGGSTTFGTTLGNPGNNSLTWETSKQLDIGLDLNMFNYRLNLVFDYFNNETTDLLLTKNVVPSSGYSTFLTNIGSMRNKGVEVTLNVKIIDSKDWEWSVGGNITTNNQEILDLGGDDEILNFFGALRRVVGGELQQIRGPKAIGIAREGDDQSAQPLKTPGAVIYEDVDGNGSISNFLGPDGPLIGDTNLDLIYGINTNLKYRNWELSALMNGQSGAYVYDFFLIQIGAPFRRTNLSKEYWYDGRYISEANPGDGRTPAADGFDPQVGPVSSLGVQKTDYLRIRNVTLTYNLPNSILEKLRMSNGRVFTSVENLYTFTSFVGGNPEARRASAGGPALIGGSQIPSVTDGRELGLNSPPGLPLPRTWTLGLSVNF
jgi:TonB-linked SusC/RagA family outer membrane protein